MKSEQINELAKALILFHVKCEAIKKDAKNPFFKSTYASLPKIIEAITEPLAESGLALTMFPIEENSLYCLLMHTSGQWIEAQYTMKPVKDTPQDKGSCITYARRYCISSILNLQIDDLLADDDGNKASAKVTPKDDGKPWLNAKTTEFAKAEKYIIEGGSIDKIKEKYKLNKEVENYFTSLKTK